MKKTFYKATFTLFLLPFLKLGGFFLITSF